MNRNLFASTCLLTLNLGGFLNAQTVQNGAYQAAAQYSREHRGEALQVYQNGKLVFEEYANGFKSGQAHKLASGTKSFSRAIAVAAQQDGLLRLDERVSDTIGEWKGDPQRAQITVRQLLSLSAGLRPGKDEIAGAGNRNLEAIAQPLEAAPGTRFIYGPASFGVFSELMTRKLKGDPVAYLERRVLTPIGLKVAHWNRDASGNASLFGGLWLEAGDWAKYGQFIAQNGVWNGKQVLPADLLAQCFKPSAANPAYGLTFWLSASVPPEVDGGRAQDSRGRPVNPPAPGAALPPDFRMAAGAGKQRLYIVPGANLVVVRYGDGGPWSDTDFFKLLLP